MRSFLSLLILSTLAVSGCIEAPGSNNNVGTNNSSTTGANCIPETDETLLEISGLECGEFEVMDRCGYRRILEPGDVCAEGVRCDDNICGCPCEIDGNCYRDGANNPENDCQECVVELSTTEWQARPVDEDCRTGISAYCIKDGICRGGTCIPQIIPERCLIDEKCYNEGEKALTNTCQECVTAESQLGWSTAPNGEFCEFGTCGQGVCASGACVDDSADLDDCTQGYCSGTCDTGPVCSLTETGTCVIDGVCYPDQMEDPDDTCRFCNSNTDPDAWTTKNSGDDCTSRTVAFGTCSNGACRR